MDADKHTDVGLLRPNGRQPFLDLLLISSSPAEKKLELFT